MTEYTTFHIQLHTDFEGDILCFLAYLHRPVCVMGHCCSYISHCHETAVTRTYPKSSLICRCGLAATLHATSCLARGLLFARHPARFHSGFERWLWERQFTMTHTGPQNMSDTVYCGVHILPVLLGECAFSGLILVHHYTIFILHAVWIAGPGAHGLVMYMSLHCTFCFVIC